MRVAVVHNAVDEESRTDEQDVLAQVAMVSRALKELGHQPVPMHCDLDLSRIKHELLSLRPDMVFNLVESLDGKERLIHLFPALLDSMGLPYTGSCTEAILISSHKVMAKERMVSVSIPTPPWWKLPPAGTASHHPEMPFGKTDRWLVKSVWEHGSFGLEDDEFLTDVTPDMLKQVLTERAPRFGGACFAEIYVPGREFNLSILDGIDGPEMLPPAEIVFKDFDSDKLRIVGYRAKWDAGSYEYHHTPRCFDFSVKDNGLLEELKSLALRCWELFGLKGYARVDFRVDPKERPWILEVNANPCLSPDAGFAAAVCRGNLSYADAISRIIHSAL